MNDRQRLEAIVTVVCKYLPPDGISREDAMREIIGLVDPLPEQEHKPWVGLTDDEIKKIMQRWRNGYIDIKDVEQLLKDKNT